MGHLLFSFVGGSMLVCLVHSTLTYICSICMSSAVLLYEEQSDWRGYENCPSSPRNSSSFFFSSLTLISFLSCCVSHCTLEKQCHDLSRLTENGIYGPLLMTSCINQLNLLTREQGGLRRYVKGRKRLNKEKCHFVWWGCDNYSLHSFSTQERADWAWNLASALQRERSWSNRTMTAGLAPADPRDPECRRKQV